MYDLSETSKSQKTSHNQKVPVRSFVALSLQRNIFMIKLVFSPEFLFVAKNATEKKTINRKEFPYSGETEEIG